MGLDDRPNLVCGVVMTEKEIARFESRYEVVAETGCWLWLGRLSRQGGYGWFDLRRDARKAHRVSYELHRGPIPGGLEMDHLCRVRRCVNPHHLEPVTHAINVTRGLGSHYKYKTHCVNGHVFSDDNLYKTRPNRDCKTCARDRSKRRYLQSKKEVAP